MIIKYVLCNNTIYVSKTIANKKYNFKIDQCTLYLCYQSLHLCYQRSSNSINSRQKRLQIKENHYLGIVSIAHIQVQITRKLEKFTKIM